MMATPISTTVENHGRRRSSVRFAVPLMWNSISSARRTMLATTTLDTMTGQFTARDNSNGGTSERLK